MSEQVFWDDINEGDALPIISPDCSTQQLVVWAGASGDFYQIHYDIPFAKNTGLDNIIVHGALKQAFLGRLLHDWAAPDGRIEKFGCSYRGMDYPAENMSVSGTVTSKYTEGDRHLVDVEVWTENPDGRKTTPGTARVALPVRS
jgi:acyl dehydratase